MCTIPANGRGCVLVSCTAASSFPGFCRVRSCVRTSVRAGMRGPRHPLHPGYKLNCTGRMLGSWSGGIPCRHVMPLDSSLLAQPSVNHPCLFLHFIPALALCCVLLLSRSHSKNASPRNVLPSLPRVPSPATSWSFSPHVLPDNPGLLLPAVLG